LALLFTTLIGMGGCDLIRMKKEKSDAENARKTVARVHNSFLYQDELSGIIPAGNSR
jgi:hypothetical protein